MGGISTGLSGILAAQYAIYTTGSNISNAASEGYARREVVLAPTSAKMNTSTNQTDSGVKVETVIRNKDMYLEGRVQSYGANVAQYEVLSEQLLEIEGLMQEPSDSGLSQGIQDFFNEWQTVASEPEDLTNRTMLLMTASNLTDRLSEFRDSIAAIQQSLSTEITNAVDQANTLAEQIAQTNMLIGQSNNDSGASLSLQDDLDRYVRQLAELTGAANSTPTDSQAPTGGGRHGACHGRPEHPAQRAP